MRCSDHTTNIALIRGKLRVVSLKFPSSARWRVEPRRRGWWRGRSGSGEIKCPGAWYESRIGKTNVNVIKWGTRRSLESSARIWIFYRVCSTPPPRRAAPSPLRPPGIGKQCYFAALTSTNRGCNALLPGTIHNASREDVVSHRFRLIPIVRYKISWKWEFEISREILWNFMNI